MFFYFFISSSGFVVCEGIGFRKVRVLRSPGDDF